MYTQDNARLRWFGETSITAVATVPSAGLVSLHRDAAFDGQCKGTGNGGLVATALVSVCMQNGSLGSLTSLKIMAPPQTLSNPGEKAQYIAARRNLCRFDCDWIGQTR